MNRIYDSAKVDIHLSTTSIASTTVTGEYLSVSDYRTICSSGNIGPMAAGNTVVFQLTQAIDRNGTSVKNISGATCTATANTNVNELKVTLTTVSAGDTLTVNGLVFTAHATTTTVANREFSVAGTDTNDAVNLVTCLNDPVYGVPNIDAENTANVITISAFEDLGASVTAVSSAGTMVVATEGAEAYLEISTDLLDIENGFSWVGISVTTNATITVGCAAGRARARYSPLQSFAATYLAN